MEYILKCKDIPVLRYEENISPFNTHDVVEVKEVYNKDSLPVHLYLDGKADATNKYALCEKLERFLDSRLIPYNRSNFKELLQKLELKSSFDLAKKSFHLSLTDPYWVCPVAEVDKIAWSKINFFDNPYKSLKGLRLIESDAFCDIKDIRKSTFSPDNTTSGQLPKKWILQDGKSFLLKGGSGTECQEPLNEVLASEICRRLKIKHTPYQLQVIENKYYSLCPNMCDKETELVPMDALYTDLNLKKNGCYDYKKLLTRCSDMKIPNAEVDLLKIFVLDYLVANEDRHSYNFGFLRDTNTFKWLGVAPVYDTGFSMYQNCLDFEIDNAVTARAKAKPFAPTQGEQLKLLPVQKLKTLLDFSKLSDIDKWYKDFLSPLKRLNEGKKEALCKKLLNNLCEVIDIINSRA